MAKTCKKISTLGWVHEFQTATYGGHHSPPNAGGGELRGDTGGQWVVTTDADTHDESKAGGMLARRRQEAKT